MASEFTLVVLLLVGGVLLALVLRFVQPELIYGLRQALVQVQANKAFLDYSSGRPGVDADFQKILIQDYRYEALDPDEEYVFRRIDKIRELYRTLDLRRPLSGEKPAKDQKPQVCIVELAGLLANLGRQVRPKVEFNQSVISGKGLLTIIANEVRKAQHEPPLESDALIEEWFTEYPISIEQTIEILIAAALGLAYRQSAILSSGQPGLALRSRPDETLRAVLKMEKRLRFLIRVEYQKKYRSEQDRHERMRGVLGEKTYEECLRRMEDSRRRSRELALDFIDFMYIGQQETLIFGEWDLFRHKFGDKAWLKERLEKSIQVRNELAHGRPIPERDAMLVVGYCGEIEEKIR